MESINLLAYKPRFTTCEAANGANSSAMANAVGGSSQQQRSSFLDNPGAYLPSLPQEFVDFAAGVGDGIFLGYSDEVRGFLGIDGGIDPSSAEYRSGYALGVTATTSVVTRVRK